jgi:hypothetical protein
MADETPPQGGTPPPAANDEIKNLKAEFSRKLDNTNSQLQAVLEALKKPAAPAPAAPAQKAPSAEDFWYDEPAKAKALLESEIATKVKAEITTESKREREYQQRFQTVVNGLYNDYPELNDESHEMTKRAREIYSTFSDAEKAEPLALDVASRRAASEFGIRPKSKRGENDDNFTLSGSASGTKPAKKKEEISEATLMAAQLMGRDINDPKVKERLKAAASRKKWNSYE